MCSESGFLQLLRFGFSSEFGHQSTANLGNPYSLKDRSSFAFEGSLARNSVPWRHSSKGLLYQRAAPGFLSYVHFAWQACDFRGILRSGTSFCVTGVGDRQFLCAFGGHVLWQALVNLDDVFKRPSLFFFWWNCRHSCFGAWWSFGVACARLRMPQAYFSWPCQKETFNMFLQVD